MKSLATFVIALLASVAVHAQGIIWTVNLSSTGGNGEGAGPIPNREIAFGHVANPLFPTSPSLNPRDDSRRRAAKHAHISFDDFSVRNRNADTHRQSNNLGRHGFRD